MNPSQPLGVHPFGVLLYWLITGQPARRTRVQVARIPQGTAPTLQFILIKCLGKSYASLAALQADVERAGGEHAFRSLVQLIAQQRDQGASSARVAGRPPEPVAARVATSTAQPPRPRAHLAAIPVASTGPSSTGPAPVRLPSLESQIASDLPVSAGAPEPGAVPSLEYRKVPIGGPFIPTDDRPWALPPRPQDGYRKFVVPPPPNQVRQGLVRWAAVGGITAVSFAAAIFLVWEAGFIPQDYLPLPLRSTQEVSALPGFAQAGVGLGTELPPEPGAPSTLLRPEDPDFAQSRRLAEANRPQVPAAQVTPVPAPRPTPTAGSAMPPRPLPTPTPAPILTPAQPTSAAPTPTQPPLASVTPPAQSPEAPQSSAAPPVPNVSTANSLDAAAGGVPVLLVVDGHASGYAFMFPHPRNPYISLGAFNSLLGRNLFWAPMDGGGIRIFTGSGSFFTPDVDVVDGRLWLKLTPSLQQALGVQLQAVGMTEIQFALRHP